MSIFGWSLPAGCGRLPGEEDEQPHQPRCRHCKAFLTAKPDFTSAWEATEECDGRYYEELHGTLCGKRHSHEPHRHVIDAGTTLSWTCTRCHRETTESG